LSIQKGPKDKFSRRFTTAHYTRILPNNEKCDRDWLVYCKELDRTFYFCCNLLRKGHGKGQLQNEGFCGRAHISTRLKEHEVTSEHVTNMVAWRELCTRFDKN
jgi:hypothetical protein